LVEGRGFTSLENRYEQVVGIRATKVEDLERSPQAIEYTEWSACFSCRFTEPIAHGLAAYQCLGTRFCHMPPVIGTTGSCQMLGTRSWAVIYGAVAPCHCHHFEWPSRCIEGQRRLRDEGKHDTRRTSVGDRVLGLISEPRCLVHRPRRSPDERGTAQEGRVQV
jgi:hypothetical protein